MNLPVPGLCDQLWCGYVKLFLGEDEVDRRVVCCFGLQDNKKRVPYGGKQHKQQTLELFIMTSGLLELSGVDKQQTFGCL